MRRWKDIGYTAGLAAVFVAGLFAGGTSQAGEFRWVASEMMPPRWAIWQPSQVMMEDEDLKDRLTFILENPTKEEHAFAVRGMFGDDGGKEHGGHRARGGAGNGLSLETDSRDGAPGPDQAHYREHSAV